jgi:hypothetical protein
MLDQAKRPQYRMGHCKFPVSYWGKSFAFAKLWLCLLLVQSNAQNDQPNAHNSFDHSVLFGTVKVVDGLLGDVWNIAEVQAAAMGNRLLYNGTEVDATALRRFLFAQQKAANEFVFMMYTCFTDGEWFAYYNNGSSVPGYAYTYAMGNRSFMPAGSFESECSRLCNGTSWCRCKWCVTHGFLIRCQTFS